MGAQSFDDRVLAALGRVHDAGRVAGAVAALRAARVPAVNLDLIYGGPGEDAASWSATMAAAVALAPEHLSAYALTIEPATKFGRLVAAGRMAEPAEDDLADRYEVACATLAAAGYAHYEVSNWARGGHASLPQPHLLAAGRYLGLGAGAHEFDGTVRRWNVDGVPACHKPSASAGGPPPGRSGSAPGRRGSSAGAAAADGRRARPGRGPWPGRRPRRRHRPGLRRPACWAPGRTCG